MAAAASNVGVVMMMVAAAVSAGCLEAGSTLSTEEAPLGPNSLAVPAARDGAQARHWFNESGKQVVYSMSNSEAGMQRDVRTYDVRSDLSQGIVRVSEAFDRFGRPFAGVRVERVQVVQDASGSDPPPTFELERSETRVVFEEASRRAQYTDTKTSGTTHFNGRTGTHSSEQRQYAGGVGLFEYGVSMDEMRYQDLSGQVLVLGKPIPFNYTFEAGFGAKYRIWINLTPVRSAEIDGLRVFELQPRYGFEVLQPPTYPPEIKAEIEKASTKRPVATASRRVSRPPEPTNSIWYAATCPFPVRWEFRNPFQADGTWMWQNQTGELASCRLGGAPIQWHEGTPLASVDRLPEASTMKASELHDGSPDGFAYPMSKAWSNVRDDALLRTFQDHRARYPPAYPFLSTYIPDSKNSSYTWEFALSEGQRPAVGISRLTDLPAPAPFDLVQNDERQGGISDGGFFSEPLSRENLTGTDVVSLRDARRVYDSVMVGEPMLRLKLQALTILETRNVYWADFVPREWLQHPGGATGYIMNAGKGVTVDLVDGGLVGFNVSLDIYLQRYQWPATTLPRPQSLAVFGIDPWEPALARPGARDERVYCVPGCGPDAFG